ncbi:hypothetical protein [Planosporangium mesophilum]|nr:hypothetical protein [Planosporangium mesophilum]NJC83985.1 hypothetical protein [Planosporangium mesophilum]
MSKLEPLQDGGMRAVWRGREYRITGDGKGLQRRYFLIRLHPDDPDLEGAVVYDEDLGSCGIPIDPSELDAWYSTSWQFTWRGAPFWATHRSEDEVAGQLMGSNYNWAKANGLALFDRDWAVGQFPLSEIEDLHEERRDLLAEWKSKRAQAELKRERNQ